MLTRTSIMAAIKPITLTHYITYQLTSKELIPFTLKQLAQLSLLKQI